MLSSLVRGMRLELTCRNRHYPPQSSVSTNFTTRAFVYLCFAIELSVSVLGPCPEQDSNLHVF